jgi:hypothetical protein
MVEAPSSSKLVPDVLGGNKRSGISKDDLAQALSDIRNWLKENAKEYYAECLESEKGQGEDAVKASLGSNGEEGNMAAVLLWTKFSKNLQLLDTYKTIDLATKDAKFG